MPEVAPTRRVVLYVEAVGVDQLEVYYFIDTSGRVASAFLSQE